MPRKRWQAGIQDAADSTVRGEEFGELLRGAGLFADSQFQRLDPAAHQKRIPRAELRQDLADYAAVDVGQAEVAAGVAEGEAFVVQAQLMQQRRVQVVQVDFVFDGEMPDGSRYRSSSR